jgi:hypothetical protein
VVEVRPGGTPFVSVMQTAGFRNDRIFELRSVFALVAVAERENILRIFTIDKADFRIYRIHGRMRFTVVP